jgi:hypothetical protein
MDQAALLWEQLRSRNETTKPKHHPDILRRAAELVSSCPNNGVNYFQPMSFSAKRWAAYLARKGIPWPHLPSGALALDDDTFREMARAYRLPRTAALVHHFARAERRETEAGARTRTAL